MDKIKKLQAILFGAISIVALVSYSIAGFSLHFFVHFFSGITVGLIFLIVLSHGGIKVKRYEYIIPFLFWVYAVIPEFIVVAQQHPKWTNIFLFHELLDGLVEKFDMAIFIIGLVALFIFLIYLKLRNAAQCDIIFNHEKNTETS